MAIKRQRERKAAQRGASITAFGIAFTRRLLWLPLLATSILILAPIQEASADAMVSVRAYWDVYLGNGFPAVNGPPAGISISCLGDATIFTAAGCQDHLSLNVSNDSGSLETFQVNSTGGIEITNSTDLDYAGVVLFFSTDFSAFNPGGPDIGASITDPGVEDASFTSSVRGTGVDDFHSCNTSDPLGYNGGGQNFSPTTCGVGLPDSSNEEFAVALPAPGSSIDISPYTINISASLLGVPEPATLSLLGAGLAGVLGMRRRKKNAAR